MNPHMGATLKTGKCDFVHDDRDLKWSDIRPSGLVVPSYPKPRGGFGMDFSNWGMLGNGPQDDNAFPADWAAAGGAGDCVVADAEHSEMEQAKNAGRSIPRFGTKTSISTYSTLTALTQGGAYDPQTGNNDTGLNIRDMLDYRQKTGIKDNNGNVYKIGPYFSIEPGNLTEFWEVLWFAEKITMGVQLQQIQMDEFENGQELTYSASSPTIGGHDEVIVGHPVSAVWTGVMWAARYTMQPTVITHTCDEAWSYFDPEEISAVTGKDYEGYNAAQVQEYLATIAAQFPLTATSVSMAGTATPVPESTTPTTGGEGGLKSSDGVKFG